jgi:hypothetical protein
MIDFVPPSEPEPEPEPEVRRKRGRPSTKAALAAKRARAVEERAARAAALRAPMFRTSNVNVSERELTAQVPGARLDPPDSLTPEQKIIWAEITSETPSQWFTSENGSLLAQLTRHIDASNYLSKLIEVEKALPPDVYDWDRMKEMLSSLRAESSAIISLSTKLKLTNVSRYGERRVPSNKRRQVSIGGGKPWNDWRDRPRDSTTQ